MDIIDITVIGSGIASTLTLIEVFGILLNDPHTSKKTIAVIEKNQEFWKGIPYGSRSSVNALTITSIHDFINENERPAFFDWLKTNKDTWIANYSKQGGVTAAQWIEKNLQYIEDGAWETVYVPRFLYGNYLVEKFTALLKAVEEKQLVEIKLIHAEAIDLKVITNGLHEITLEHPDSKISKIISRKVVISTGSAPVRSMLETTDKNMVYINDIYEPSVSDNIKTVHTALKNTDSAPGRNILIIGSNASSIELLYLLEGMPEMRKLINKTVVISPSGMLPYHISTEVLEVHPIPNLDKVRSLESYDIQTLVDAAALDIKLSLHDGANMDYVATIIRNTLELMEVLGETAKREFFAIHAIRLRDMFRRSGPDYKDVSNALLDLGEVIIVKGRFLKTHRSDSGILLNYLDVTTGKEQTYPLSFKAIINCSGSDNLDQSSSRLLFNLVNNDICKMNLSGKGFEVNEKFEAAPNIYVMGPLLGGNVNKLIHFWQLENASRLTYLAPYLAKELLIA